MTDVKFTANGTEYTNVTPGWSVQESATPVVPGQFADSTGLVSATIRGSDDELLLIDEQFSAVTPLGTIDGPIKSTSQTGELGVSITQGTYLDQFDAERRIPANSTGNLQAELYLMCQAIGTATLPSYLPSNALTGYSVPFIGSTYDPTGTVGFETLFPALPSYPEPYAVEPIGTQHYGVNIVDTSTVGVLPLRSTGRDIYPGFQLSAEVACVFQWMIDLGTDARFIANFGIGSGASFPGYQNLLEVDVRQSTKTLRAKFDSVSYAALDDSQPLLLTFAIYPNVSGGIVSYIQSATLTDHTNARVTVTQSDPLEYGFPIGGNSVQPYYYSFSGTTGVTMMNVYTMNRFDPSPVDADTDYITVDTSLPFDTADLTPQVPSGAYPAVVGNVWEQMQNLCSATNVEIYSTQNGFGVRDTLLRDLDVKNVVPSPTLTIGRGQAGRFVEIENNNARVVNGSIYSAVAANDQPITVAFGETVEVTVGAREVFPIAVNNPVKYDWSAGDDTDVPGYYTVVDSTGLQLLGTQFEDFGGKITANLSTEVDGGILITVRGPDVEIPSTTAPYTIGLSDGQVVRPFLNLTGVAVVADNQVVRIPTGAVESVITREVAGRVVNPFINTVERAYDRGIWAARQANGVSVTTNASYNFQGGVGLADAPGGRIDLRNGKYRVNSATLAGLRSDLTVEAHYTAGDQEAVWGSLTAGDFDAAWGGRPAKEFLVFPEKYNP